MPRPPAIFVDDRQTYHADTCQPLRRAMAAGQVRCAAVGRGGYPGRPLGPRVLPAVRSVGVWDATGPQTWGLDWHRNEGLELTYLERGRCAFATEGGSHTLRPGTLTITRPWQAHRVGDPHIESCRLTWIILDVGVRRPNQAWRWPEWLLLERADRERLTALLRHNEQAVWPADDELAGTFAALGALLIERDADGTAPRTTRLKLLINQVFVALLEMLERRRIPLDESLPSTQRTVAMFLDALPRHIDYPWDLATMARQCGLGRSRFVYLCRQLTNMSPAEYLAHCRIERAKAMLRDCPERSVTQVALACGFRSSQYFATVFRRHTGVSPREWRVEATASA